MLKLSKFGHNHYPSGVKLLVKNYQTWNPGFK